jgi:hypothetical protein
VAELLVHVQPPLKIPMELGYVALHIMVHVEPLPPIYVTLPTIGFAMGQTQVGLVANMGAAQVQPPVTTLLNLPLPLLLQ